MTRKLKLIPAIIAAAGIMAAAFAQGVPMQTVQDSASGNRLVINGKPIFISGMNIAWNNFARDVGNSRVNINAFVNQFKQIRGAGGNAVRWWLHTDAQVDPIMDMATGRVTGLGTRTISNIQEVLDSAYTYGIVVSLCLFSFDILHNDGGNKSAEQMARNLKFMTEPENLDSYIQNALKPMLEAVGNHPAIMCWEVFNEPEGMANNYGWATTRIDHSHIIRFTAKIAGEVRRNTKKMASTGIHNFHNYVSLYTVEKLKAVDPDGWLDFYMAHHYPQYESRQQSPFYNPASHWGFDRPVLIGEFPAQSWGPGAYPHFYNNEPLDIKDAYEYAFNNGYLGVMSWSMTEGDKAKFGSFETTKPALEHLWQKDSMAIKIRDVNIVNPTGDLAMKAVFEALAPGEENEALLRREGSLNIAGKTNLVFEIFIDQQSGSNLELYPALQTSGDWGWYTTDDPIDLGSYDKGQWVKVEIPVASLKRDGTTALAPSASIFAVFFKFVTSDTSPFTGTLYFDNVGLDSEIFSNFNQPASEWSIANGDVSVSLAPRPGAPSSVLNGTRPAAITRAPIVSVTGKILNVKAASDADMQIRLINVKGKTVARFKAAGDAKFSIAKVPAGRYIVETRVAGKRVGSTPVIVR